jgi:hypothetical protein
MPRSSELRRPDDNSQTQDTSRKPLDTSHKPLKEKNKWTGLFGFSSQKEVPPVSKQKDGGLDPARNRLSKGKEVSSVLKQELSDPAAASENVQAPKEVQSGRERPTGINNQLKRGMELSQRASSYIPELKQNVDAITVWARDEFKSDSTRDTRAIGAAKLQVDKAWTNYQNDVQTLPRSCSWLHARSG